MATSAEHLSALPEVTIRPMSEADVAAVVAIELASYRFPWSATPAHAPSLAASTGAGGTAVLYASWNGATGVAGWRVLAGSSPQTLASVGQFPRGGFETKMVVRTTQRYVAVQALGPEGQLLGSSGAVKL